MISEVHNALFDFWGQFGFPVYLQGEVPQNSKGVIQSTYPYITMASSNGEPFETDMLTAFCWHKKQSGVSANAERLELLDQIAAAIPPEGALLSLEGGGKVLLSRYPAGFEMFYNDPEDDTVVGSRIAYQLRYLTI